MTYSFSKIGKERLASCHPDLQLIFNRVILLVDCSIFCGYRGKAEQDKAVAGGFSKLPWPKSLHNQDPSMAVDAGPYFLELRSTDWKDELAFARFAGVVDAVAKQYLMEGAVTHKLVWGGDWDNDGRSLDERWRDLPHFQLEKP